VRGFSDFLCVKFFENEAKSDNQFVSSLINADNSDSSHFRTSFCGALIPCTSLLSICFVIFYED
jgi:hypothetical protein